MRSLAELGRDVLRALRNEPLDVHQLAAELAVIPVAVTAELRALSEAGLIHGETMETGRQAWSLTVKGRTRLAGEAKR
ncbi:MAG TPA: ArsR family transcriptional regulator [Solirubrobacteraceae bacterium]|nr:ArsR family transcriptional regulator [Solirubrobacteraceae bacterium]